MKRILVPVDCSDVAARALHLATELSARSNARVYVLRVIKTPGGALFDSSGEIVEDHANDVNIYRERMKAESAHLQQWIKAINPNAFPIVKYGGVADVILQSANKYKVNMIILGNRFSEETPWRFFGDLTSYLIKRSSVPILSLKVPASDNATIRNIVFANEFDGNLSYFDLLQDIHQYTGAQLDFLYIRTDDDTADEDIRSNMDYFARANMIANYQKHIHRSENIERGIIEWISENPCDLLAVKNVKRTGSPLFRPKLTEKMLRNTRTSTLIYND